MAIVLAVAPLASAQSLSITDARVVEGSVGQLVTLTVTLSPPSPSLVSVEWRTVGGSAAAGSDFVNLNDFVTFAPLETTKTLDVQVLADTTFEWSPTLQQDEAFFVDLENPSGATIRKGRGVVTIVDDDDSSKPRVQFLSAVSRGTATSGEVRLQWRVPAWTFRPPDEFRVKWNTGSSCSFPPTSASSSDGETDLSANTPGQQQVWVHAAAASTVYCYSVFAKYTGASGGDYSGRAEIQVRTFDASGSRKWTYWAGAFSVVPPTVGSDAIVAVSNDGVVHAMGRGAAGGGWPAAWNPVALGKAAHNRSPIVPTPAGGRLFVGTEAGEIHALDTANGSVVWSRSAAFGASRLPSSGGVQATPAGVFRAWGGSNDLILVGTAASSGNRFYALDPATGADWDWYPRAGDSTPGPLSPVLGMATVDYARNKVYFANDSSSDTVRSLDLGAPGTPDLTRTGAPWAEKDLDRTGNALVLRNGRIYLGDGAKAYSVSAIDSDTYDLTTNDGAVKGFVFPDRRDDRVYFSTDTRVWCVRDTGSLTAVWSLSNIPSPSVVLHWPGTDHLYVGGSNGRVYQLDVSAFNPWTTQRSVLLDPAGSDQVGAPSLDIANGLLIVSTSSGAIHAVAVPF
ncbi:MAG TPA: PQQ-binding-like beta-propeller repeat protein [Vicinamibacteria bacterium]|nr:PQQ-binding-like beta-propeller repeat protein [Vicinamibacteria bacterium]